jgi:hypothetical protein
MHTGFCSVEMVRKQETQRLEVFYGVMFLPSAVRIRQFFTLLSVLIFVRQCNVSSHEDIYISTYLLYLET